MATEHDAADILSLVGGSLIANVYIMAIDFYSVALAGLLLGRPSSDLHAGAGSVLVGLATIGVFLRSYLMDVLERFTK